MRRVSSSRKSAWAEKDGERARGDGEERGLASQMAEIARFGIGRIVLSQVGYGVVVGWVVYRREERESKGGEREEGDSVLSGSLRPTLIPPSRFPFHPYRSQTS